LEAVNQTPFQFAPLVGRLSYPKHSLTVIVKGTFDLVPEAPAGIADEQLPITGDLPYPDDEEGTGSPYYESDLGHFKPQADLLLVGTCHAPGGQPRPVCRATFAVGEKSRALMVVGERQWQHRLLRTAFSDPQPFTEMALRYENSFGGEGFAANPVGKGFIADGAKDQPQHLPNVEDPAEAVASPKSRPQPAGFGPLARTWQPRTSQIGTYGEQWFKTRAPWFPEDMDWAVFNAAPPEMRVEGYLRGDEEIFLENIHPEHAKFHGRLPGLRVRSFLNESRQEAVAGERPPSPGEGPDGAERFREVPMRLDTLWVDGEAGKLVLVWRGTVEVLSDEYEEVQHLFILSEPVGEASQSVAECQAVFLASLPEPAPETDEMGDPIEPGQAEEPPPPEADSEVAVEDDEELEALLAEMDPKDAALLKGVLAREEAQMQARIKEAGLDPSKPLLMTPEDEKGLIEKLKELGVAEEDLDWAVEEPEAEPLPPLTRELVEERVTLGETFEGEDLSGLDLSGLEMMGVDFSKAIFTHAVLKEAKLAEANLSGANLVGVDLSEADLTNAQLAGADLTGADLSGACLEEVEAPGVKLDGADLTAGRLDGATLSAASMTRAKLDQATAANVDFSGTDLTGASFQECVLESANFSQAVLVGVDFAGANLRKATMDAVVATQVNMEGADLTGAQAWRQADFTDGVFRRVTAHQSGWDQAVLTGADFSYADMQGADFTKASLEGADLSAADVKLGCFRKARLRGARLVQMNLFNGIMAYADLTDADLSGSNMYGVDFSDAVIERTRTEGTNLKKTKLHPA
jgi:uncharacterized protein YjbI with pentapeptide repeats